VTLLQKRYRNTLQLISRGNVEITIHNYKELKSILCSLKLDLYKTN